MIGRLRGVLVWKRAPALLLDVNGVGYELEAPMSTFYDLPRTGEEVMLHTHLLVREDAHLLYGFSSEAERRLFRELLKVNGVGAKVALVILSGMSADAFGRCVHDHDTASLVRLPGIGKKTAERLIIEMRDRLKPSHEGGALPDMSAVVQPSVGSPTNDAVSALIALGFKAPEASRMVQAVNSEGMTSEELIRNALKASAKG